MAIETEREKEREREKCKYLNLHAPFLFACFCRERGGRDGDERPTCEGYSDLMAGWVIQTWLCSLHRPLGHWKLARAGRRRTSWKPSWSKMTNLSPHTSLRSCWIWTNWVHPVIWCWNMHADEHPYFLASHTSVKLWLTESAFSHICWVLRFGFRAGTANKTEPLPHSCSKSTELGCHRIWWYEWRWPSGPL